MLHPLVVGSAVPIKAARKEAQPMRGGFHAEPAKWV
jgi:hypothetical protein